MADKDCGLARSLKIVFGLFFGFMALGLFLLGVTYLPFFGFLLAALFFMISVLFLLSPRDESCYLTR